MAAPVENSIQSFEGLKIRFEKKEFEINLNINNFAKSYMMTPMKLAKVFSLFYMNSIQSFVWNSLQAQPQQPI